MMKKHLIIGMVLNAKMRPKEVAEVLSVSRPNVRVTLSRARNHEGVEIPRLFFGRNGRGNGAIKAVIIEALIKGIPPAWVAYELGKPLPQVTSLFAYYRRQDKSLPRFQFKSGKGTSQTIAKYEAFKREHGIA